MRDFVVKDNDLVVFEGVLFADGKVVINGMPPAQATMVFPSIDMAKTIMHDMKIEWLDATWVPVAWGA